MEGLTHYKKEERPWGNFERFTLNEATTVKLIAVKAGEEFSLQSHAHRSEFWRILSGSGTVTLDETHTQVQPGEHFFIPAGHTHRMEAGPDGLVFLEIAFGQFEEDDVTRLEDKYGRI